MIGKCPVCEADLRVSELSCPSCHTRIVGDLATCEFCNLDGAGLDFLRAFLRARGNIRLVEKELGISYPTVRRRLDELLSSLGLEAGSRPSPDQRQEILGRLETGEITVEDALHLLEGRTREDKDG